MKNRIVRLVPLAILVSLLLYILPYSRRPFSYAAVNFATDATSTASDNLERLIEESLRDIANTTLGFEKVFAVGLRDRMDKRDAMTIGASLSGIHLKWIDGVHLSEMSDKSYPAGWNTEDPIPAQLGAWRAHMNALQRIVNEGISTALIFEDDIDWDVTIKAQLKQFARGVRALQETTSVSSFSPYGENWDVLWLGGCGAGTKPSSRVYMIPNDTTVPPRSRHFPTEILKPVFAEWEGMENARFVFDAADVPCSLAYAVTFESARKTLIKWSLEPNSQPFDNDLRELCNPFNSHGTSLRCLAPYPLLFNSYRKEGPDFLGSDIHNDGDLWHEAFTNGITYSTMLNSKRLVNGAKTALAQYPEVNPQLLEFEGLELPRGNLTSWNLRLYQPE